jgi:hypothetical protein
VKRLFFTVSLKDSPEINQNYSWQTAEAQSAAVAPVLLRLQFYDPAAPGWYFIFHERLLLVCG